MTKENQMSIGISKSLEDITANQKVVSIIKIKMFFIFEFYFLKFSKNIF